MVPIVRVPSRSRTPANIVAYLHVRIAREVRCGAVEPLPTRGEVRTRAVKLSCPFQRKMGPLRAHPFVSTKPSFSPIRLLQARGPVGPTNKNP